jgi:hypothetical protein
VLWARTLKADADPRHLVGECVSLFRRVVLDIGLLSILVGSSACWEQRSIGEVQVGTSWKGMHFPVDSGFEVDSSEGRLWIRRHVVSDTVTRGGLLFLLAGASEARNYAVRRTECGANAERCRIEVDSSAPTSFECLIYREPSVDGSRGTLIGSALCRSTEGDVEARYYCTPLECSAFHDLVVRGFRSLARHARGGRGDS